MANSTSDALTQSFCERFRVCVCPDRSTIWASDKTDLSVLNYVSRIADMSRLPRRISDEALSKKIATFFGESSSEQNAMGPEAQQTGNNGTVAADSRIVKEINAIVASCIRQQASDIHFEPGETHLTCRARIDGVLQEKAHLPSADAMEVLSRIKIMSGLDIAEKRRPQDGRIRFELDNRHVDIRVSTIPTDGGEKAVLRLLDKESLRLDLAELGFSENQRRLFLERISVPNGIVLVTGPTGSGKTTTLYAAMQHLKSPRVNISTVEDPIEYNLAGINQTQVKPEINLTFSSMLRALLRQDPNIIMIGEIRDRETLEIAIRASLTGHLVLSTIHTNSAVSTVTRLLDMGAEPYLLASSLKLIVGQRLVRKLCPDCAATTLDDACHAAAEKLGIALSQDARNSAGCSQCSETGFRGRTAIYELLSIDENLKNAINDRQSEQHLIQIANRGSYRTMVQMAADYVNHGVTTPAEVLRELNA